MQYSVLLLIIFGQFLDNPLGLLSQMIVSKPEDRIQAFYCLVKVNRIGIISAVALVKFDIHI